MDDTGLAFSHRACAACVGNTRFIILINIGVVTRRPSFRQ